MNKLQTVLAAAATTAGLTASGAQAEQIQGVSREHNSAGQAVQIEKTNGDIIVDVYAPNARNTCRVEAATNDAGTLLSYGKANDGTFRIRGTVLPQHQQDSKLDCCTLDQDFKFSAMGALLSLSTTRPNWCDRDRGSNNNAGPSEGPNEGPSEGPSDPGLGGSANN